VVTKRRQGTDAGGGHARAAGFLAVAAALVVTALAAGGPAAASIWCGENGVIRFSFAPGDSLLETVVTGEPANGLTIVDVAAWLTDVTPVARQGDAFLRVGGVELKLAMTGPGGQAIGQVIGQEFPDPRALNVGQAPGQVAVGFNPGLRLRAGSVLLARWKVLFQGRPQDVRFGLDPAGARSCATVEGCPGTGAQAVYVGADSANQMDCLFSAGFVPAWLNPTGEPDRTPVRGTASFADVGVFQAR